MKLNFCFPLLFLFLLSPFLQAQNTGHSLPPALQNEQPEVQAEIEKLVHELYESIKNKDLEKQKSFHLYSDKFTAFYGGQKRKNAEGAMEYEKNLLNAVSDDITFDIQDMQVNVFDDVAVATFHIYVTSTVKGEKKQSQAQISLVYLNVNGEWKITHEHVSALTESRD